MIAPKIIAIDFDGTCVTHDFPDIGREIGAPRVLKELAEAGHRLILWTMRSDDPETGREVLSDAIEWFQKNEIPLWAVNANPEQTWSDSPKAYAHLYIDDAALGCPLYQGAREKGVRPFADWIAIRKFLVENEYLP